jgi:hypothetical protein
MLSDYTNGLCDVMALALHRLTGLPFGIWAGRYQEDGEDCWEYAHAVVIADPDIPRWLDVNGLHEGTPSCLFVNRVLELCLLPPTEEDMRNAFTCCEIPEGQIHDAMILAQRHEPLAAAVAFFKDDATKSLKSAT